VGWAFLFPFGYSLGTFEIWLTFFLEEQLENRSSASSYYYIAQCNILVSFLCFSSLKTYTSFTSFFLSNLGFIVSRFSYNLGLSSIGLWVTTID
jgi:hypothetical protein